MNQQQAVKQKFASFKKYKWIAGDQRDVLIYPGARLTLVEHLRSFRKNPEGTQDSGLTHAYLCSYTTTTGEQLLFVRTSDELCDFSETA